MITIKQLEKEIVEFKQQLSEIVHDEKYCADYRFHGKRKYCSYCEKLKIIRTKIELLKEVLELINNFNWFEKDCEWEDI